MPQRRRSHRKREKKRASSKPFFSFFSALCLRGSVAISSVLFALDPLRLIPVSVHLFERNFRPGPSLLGDSFFDVAETAAESTLCRLERALSLRAAPACQIGDGEGDVADLTGDGFVRDFFAGDLFAQFADLLFEF